MSAARTERRLLRELSVHDPRWGAFVESCPSALPFHHPGWAALLAECYGFRPFVLAMTDGLGQITAGVPVVEIRRPLAAPRWVALPFTDYCPPLAAAQLPPDFAAALGDTVAARRVAAFEQHAGLGEGAGLYAHMAAVRHTTVLAPRPDALYNRFSKMHQRNIRKAERAGVRISWGRSARDVRTFYDLHLLTRRRLGRPVQPRRFFDLLERRMLAQDMGFVVSAHVDAMPVAAALFLHWKGMLLYKYGASDARFWGYRPNNLLFWTVLRWACEHGYHTFDWGRSDLDDQGLRAFKAGWDAREEPLVYATIATAPPRPSTQHLSNALGALICRAPPWVCRALGECLYRYAA
jgi:CelD/BcsL family acetyltransferase involved in cellulose biosynthesis